MFMYIWPELGLILLGGSLKPRWGLLQWQHMGINTAIRLFAQQFVHAIIKEDGPFVRGI